MGTFIRYRRKLQKLGQSQLAALIGVNRRWVMEIEGGKPRAEIGLVMKALTAIRGEIRIGPDGPTGPQSNELEPVDIEPLLAPSSPTFVPQWGFSRRRV
ncbi:transcriptional regulator [Novosphingobium sp. AP12]|uniref:transcriptional regulator n=1 Tax=Novosphingobium sp. AP12 TaxID=1144305 RepID=UPI0003039D8A|nr:transcriptional regulator [Novosphingobium sp. AP12]